MWVGVGVGTCVGTHGHVCVGVLAHVYGCLRARVRVCVHVRAWACACARACVRARGRVCVAWYASFGSALPSPLRLGHTGSLAVGFSAIIPSPRYDTAITPRTAPLPLALPPYPYLLALWLDHYRRRHHAHEGWSWCRRRGWLHHLLPAGDESHHIKLRGHMQSCWIRHARMRAPLSATPLHERTSAGAPQ